MRSDPLLMVLDPDDSFSGPGTSQTSLASAYSYCAAILDVNGLNELKGTNAGTSTLAGRSTAFPP
jgi:hypothetical protein